MRGTPKTLCEAFQATAARHPGTVALRTSTDATRITWAEYAQRVKSIAAGLASLGVRRTDTVALVLTNRPEFHLVDTAAMHLGAVPFSIYNTFATEQIASVLENAGSRVLVTERQFLERVQKAAANTATAHIVCIDDDPLPEVLGFHALERAGNADFDFDAAWHAVQPDDVLTIIYTSGTTGAPKGVELTHANVLAELAGFRAVLPSHEGESDMSYLPSAHIADRVWCHYEAMASGVCVTKVSDPRTIVAAVREARPTRFGAVPRVWEKIKAGLEARITTSEPPVKQAMLGALEVGLRKVRAEQAALRGLGAPPDENLLAEHARADATVFAPLRASLGLDRTRWRLAGAAPIALEVLEFFAAIGLPICEVWGMSELSCVATFNPLDRIRIGTVGLPLPGVAIRLESDGEVLVRGPIVMKGYRGRPKETAETIDGEAWLRTGDIGALDEEGYLSIIDRKKELIISSGGKNMSPANIECAIKSASPLIGQAICIGDRRPYNVALIVLEPEAAAAWAKTHDLQETDLSSLARNPRLRDALDTAVEHANQRLARVEQIKRYALLTIPWEPGGDELTPTMKLKRKPIAEKYAKEIEALYAAPGRAGDSSAEDD
ncbi:AMP-dependent synthetase/ligase [Pendulispora albinea]|uniref:Long-chain fatty acid--CoA ligase n=1 Tax=Pendulispora albinea TaxID=2741071 RepID=A0ABZ2LPK4_9BACT